jgi:ABC-2 type transport system ATP-binding protein
MIEISHVSHAFGISPVLTDVTFDVPAGSVVGLVGPNGAGKTTLMRIVATLLHPRGGTVRVGGHDSWRDAARVRAVVGFSPERATLYPELAAWEYLDLFAEIAGHDAETRARRVAQALERVSLTGRRDSPTRELSKGLRQRLALQATMMHDPKALVLDEPTDGLDPVSRAEVLGDVRALADAGCAVLLSSHVLAELDETADETVVLVDGRVVADQAPRTPRYAIRVGGDLTTARALLAAHPGVRAVAADGERIVVELAPGVADAADVAAALVGAGIRLLELVEERATLRERFDRAVKPS